MCGTVTVKYQVEIPFDGFPRDPGLALFSCRTEAILAAPGYRCRHTVARKFVSEARPQWRKCAIAPTQEALASGSEQGR